MEPENEYVKDLAAIRKMMEKSSKFLSLSGWTGVILGLYVLIAYWYAASILQFRPKTIWGGTSEAESYSGNPGHIVLLALGLILLSILTAVVQSSQKARKHGEKLWNPTSKLLMYNLFIPLVVGGMFLLVLFSKGLLGLLAPISLIFYGLALVNASKYTYDELKLVGLIQCAFGLIGAFYVELGLIFWAIGLGLIHMVYGVFMHFKYER